MTLTALAVYNWHVWLVRHSLAIQPMQNVFEPIPAYIPTAWRISRKVPRARGPRSCDKKAASSPSIEWVLDVVRFLAVSACSLEKHCIFSRRRSLGGRWQSDDSRWHDEMLELANKVWIQKHPTLVNVNFESSNTLGKWGDIQSESKPNPNFAKNCETRFCGRNKCQRLKTVLTGCCQ